MRLITQPEASSLCGQCCVAMAAGVSLAKAVEAVGHSKLRGTYTREIITALRKLGINCGDRCRRVSRKRPMLPKRGIAVIHRPKGEETGMWHWLLVWDGEVYDPAGRWPDHYKAWHITSCLEIFC